MSTVNDELFDAMVRHQIGLLRVSGSVRNRILSILDATEADIKDRIERRLANAAPGVTPANTKRLQVLMEMIRKVRAKAWTEVTAELVRSMVDIALNEAEFMDQGIQAVSPTVVAPILPEPALLRALVGKSPFEGRVLRQWAKDIAADDIKRIESAIQVGMVQGESSQQIASRVVGSARLKGTDGVTEITRQRATALTRTAVNHFSNAARREFFKANKSLFKREIYVATLDARTTPVCRANDGKTFAVGEGPMPPLHFNCRSTRVPVIDGAELGARPAKASTEQQLVREFNARKGTNAKTRDDLPRGMKGEFDKFKQRRVRELTGQVPDSVSYQTWLKRQSAAFQDDVLGRTRAALFRRGGLTLDKFVNRKGDEITLRELARREAAAFRKAGLNPEAF